jgi:nucleotide-binding universal stress UspA family protein
MIRLTRVLVATDFSDPARSALDYGRELARHFGATLHVLHVTSDLAATIGTEHYLTGLPEMQKQVDDAARQQLDALLTDDDRLDLQAKAVVRSSGATAATIVDYAREARIDAIVLGTHGRGGVSHLLMGSVAERVVRTAPCPVLTVRHPEREFVRPGVIPGVATA